MPAREGVIPVDLLAYIKKRNAKSQIRETYSTAVYKYFKKMQPVSFKNLTQKQQRIIMREEEDEGLYEENKPEFIEGIVNYIQGINYLFLKIQPDLLPKTAVEDIDINVYSWHDTKEATDAINKELARIKKIERSIEKHGYDDDYPVTIYLVQSTRTATVGYGNHRLQAVRNLIDSGVLPRDFKMPVYVIYEDNKLKAEMRRKKSKNACK